MRFTRWILNCLTILFKNIWNVLLIEQVKTILFENMWNVYLIEQNKLFCSKYVECSLD